MFLIDDLIILTVRWMCSYSWSVKFILLLIWPAVAWIFPGNLIIFWLLIFLPVYYSSTSILNSTDSSTKNFGRAFGFSYLFYHIIFMILYALLLSLVCVGADIASNASPIGRASQYVF